MRNILFFSYSDAEFFVCFIAQPLMGSFSSVVGLDDRGGEVFVLIALVSSLASFIRRSNAG
ncbi:MAG: hypothetical protein RPR28_04145 [Cycloclasticus sp.]